MEKKTTPSYKRVRKLFGLFALLISVGLVFLPVVGGFSMAGLHAGIVIFCGLGGMFLICS